MSRGAHPAPAGPFLVETPAKRQRLPQLRDGLRDWLTSVGCSAEGIDRLVLAANEAVTNCVEHAYRDGWPGPVWLRGDHLPDGTIRVTVTDAGTWRPVRPGGGRGRGVLMMQECGDDVRIERSSRGTTVTVEVAPQPQDSAESTRGAPETYEVRSRAAEDGNVLVEVSGTVSVAATGSLRLRLLAAACGGLAPLTLDLQGVGATTAGVRATLEQLADAVGGVGGRVTVRPPLAPPADGAASWLDVVEPLGIALDTAR